MQNDEFVRLFRDFTRSRERRYISIFKKALDGQLQSFLNSKKVDQQTMYEALRSLYWDAAGKYSKRMRTQFRKQKKASGQWGFIENFTESFKKFFEIYLRNLAQLITETTRQNIIDFLDSKLKEGFQLNDLVNHIEELTEANKMRARRIARTEVTAAANSAGYFSALNAEYYMTKEWIATDDSRTRQTHGHAGVQGTKIPLEDAFHVGEYELMYPGDKGGNGGSLHTGPEEVVNCRCTLGYHARRDENGRLMLKEK